MLPDATPFAVHMKSTDTLWDVCSRVFSTYPQWANKSIRFKNNEPYINHQIAGLSPALYNSVKTSVKNCFIEADFNLTLLDAHLVPMGTLQMELS